MNTRPFLRALFLTLLLPLSGCDQFKELNIYIKGLDSSFGYFAKVTCSEYFISGMSEELIREEHLKILLDRLPINGTLEINEETQSVTMRDTSFNSYFSATAQYREGLGCTLLNGINREALLNQSIETTTPNDLPSDQPWPHGSAGITQALFPEIDYAEVEAAIDEAFVENEERTRQTMAVLVVWRGELIAERYAENITPFTPLAGWSMSKSATATLLGRQWDANLINLDEAQLFPQWESGEKSEITLTNLLNMASGLDWAERIVPGKVHDQSYMLYSATDQVAYALNKSLTTTPGTEFSYNTGTSHALALYLQNLAGGEIQDSYNLFQQELFAPLDITTAIVEYDGVENPLGGSGIFMSARDWARLGLIYLQEGNYDDQTFLSPEWMQFAKTSGLDAVDYGAHIWLNTQQITAPTLPADLIAFFGAQEQAVFISPSSELMIVRMGHSLAAVSEVVALFESVQEAITTD